MKRYFIVSEFFGIRIYDSKYKKEYYYNNQVADLIKKMLKDEFNEIDNRRENELSSPLKISMNLTKKCNLRCKQCFSNSGEVIANELTTMDMKKLFDDMHKYGTFFICLGGGEPLTRTDLFDILDYGKKKQLAISIVSNGLLLNKELINKLNQMDLDTFWISLDGMEKNHEILRGKGTFKKALHALELLKKYYKGKTAIRISLNKYNINEFKDVIKIAEDYCVDLIRLTPLIDFGRAKDQNLVINQKQYIDFLTEVINIKSSVEIIYPTKTNNEKIWIGSNGFGCHCGKEAIWLDECGNYSPCFFWGEKYILGNIKEDNYLSLWEKSLKISRIDGNEVCSSCKKYKACRSGCRARSLYLFENLDEVDPLCPLKKNKKKVMKK